VHGGGSAGRERRRDVHVVHRERRRVTEGLVRVDAGERNLATCCAPEPFVLDHDGHIGGGAVGVDRVGGGAAELNRGRGTDRRRTGAATAVREVRVGDAAERESGDEAAGNEHLAENLCIEHSLGV